MRKDRTRKMYLQWYPWKKDGLLHVLAPWLCLMMIYIYSQIFIYIYKTKSIVINKYMLRKEDDEDLI